MEQFYSHQWEPWNYTPLHSSCFDSTNGPFSFSPRMYNDPFEQSYDIGNVYNAQQQCKYDSSFQTYNSDLHYRNSQEVPMHSEDCLPYISDYHSPPNYMPSPNPFSHDYTVPNSHDNDLREIRDMLNTFASNALAMQQSITDFQQERKIQKGQLTSNLEAQDSRIGNPSFVNAEQSIEYSEVSYEFVDYDLELTSSIPLDFSSPLHEKEEDEETLSKQVRIMVDDPLFVNEKKVPDSTKKVEEQCIFKKDEKPNTKAEGKVFEAKELLPSHDAQPTKLANLCFSCDLSKPSTSFPCFESCFIVCTPMPKQGRRMSLKKIATICGDFDPGW